MRKLANVLCILTILFISTAFRLGTVRAEDNFNGLHPYFDLAEENSPLPDLVVTNITLPPTSPIANSLFTVKIKVQNRGMVPSNGGKLTVWPNKISVQTCNESGGKSATIGTIANGSSKIFTITELPAGSKGIKNVLASVDSQCTVTESIENNNQFTKPYVVVNTIPTTIYTKMYTQISTGARWEYHNNEPDYEMPSLEVLGTKTKKGKQCYIVQEYDSDNYPNDQHFYLADMSTGLYSLGGINNYQTPDEEKLFWKPPLPYLLASFVPGEKYAFKTISQTTNGESSTVIGNISIKQEAVTVPAGTFTDCYKSTLSGTYDGTWFKFYIWYAKDVGMVKRVGFGGGTWELITYEP
jgi:hypothetical protein